MSSGGINVKRFSAKYSIVMNGGHIFRSLFRYAEPVFRIITGLLLLIVLLPLLLLLWGFIRRMDLILSGTKRNMLRIVVKSFRSKIIQPTDKNISVHATQLTIGST